MADVITRFKLETTQFDSKIRDAAKGLAEITKQASLAGNEFAKYTNKNVEAARAFGNIATSATNAKDKVKELVDAYNKVANAYNALTKEQQQSDFGKAMAESMTTLKSRIADAKSEMYDTGGILSSLKDKFTVNIDALKLFNMGLEAAKAALNVAKDAIFSNEQSLDEWGRVVESSESIYNGFLDALNTGDISGYLQRIAQITQAARDAYDAIDNLATYNAFNQINVEKTRTGMTESMVYFREGKATKETVKAAGDAYKKELEERRKLEKEAYLKKVAEVAAQRGVSADDLTKALSGSFGSYQSLKSLPLSGTKTVYYGGGMFGGGGSYEKAVPGSIQEKLGDALRRLNDTELKDLQALGAQAERTGNEIAQVDRQLVRILNGRQGGGSSRSGGGASNTYAPSIDDFNKILGKSLTGSVDLKEVKDQLSPFQMMLPEIEKNILGIKDADLGGALAELGNKKVVAEIATVTKEIEQQKMAFDMAAQSAATFGSALAGIQDPSIKAAGTVIQAIANIALGFSQASVNASKMGSYGWIAYLAAGMAAMATTISTIHSLTGYAEGGEIKGNSYSGDQIPIMANAGEIVLNQAQQSNVAGALRGNGFGQMRIVGVLQGTQLLMCIDNTTKSMGMGEIATFKNSN